MVEGMVFFVGLIMSVFGGLDMAYRKSADWQNLTLMVLGILLVGAAFTLLQM